MKNYQRPQREENKPINYRVRAILINNNWDYLRNKILFELKRQNISDIPIRFK